VNRRNKLSGSTPLLKACSSKKALEGRLLCVKLLLAHGADPLLADDHNRTPMAYAAKEPEKVALLESYVARTTTGLATEVNDSAAAFINGESDGNGH